MSGNCGRGDRYGREQIDCGWARSGIGKWTRREEDPKYAPDRTCDVEHLQLQLEIDLPGRSVRGVCRQRLRAAYGPFDTITLDAWDLEIHSVTDSSGRALPYTYLRRKLTVRFPRPVRDAEELNITYRVRDPIDGLFFIPPGASGGEWQLWSQGQDEGARHWIPCHDAPNERMTTEMIVTVPEKYTVISNGSLEKIARRRGKRTWHYRESVPHPSYLITLVVGVFSKIEDRWNTVPVEYYVEPGREEEGRRSFGRTPDMMEFFSRILDLPYPYEKYAQVAVRHFHFGGMENTSATTQTDGTLHDERASLDFTSDDLVAHELAHQWFGDLLTCKSWSHAWLNEGFATYFEALWKEWDKGREEFDYEMLLNAADYMGESYRRAISTPRYGFPSQMFDLHLYPKAAWVLHMLRHEVGDDAFWKAIRLYLRRHAPGVVETIDLIRSFEDASGRNLTGFFDQWIFAPGHPQLELDLAWEAEGSWVKVAAKQAQKREDGTPVFHLPLRVEARLGDGKVMAKTFRMDRPEQTFYLSLKEKPVWVSVDPESAILRETKTKRPLEWAEAILQGRHQDGRIVPRIDAVRQLGEEAGPKAIRLLTRTLLEDPFWGVQVEAARALGRIATPAALDALISGTGVEHPKARRAVVQALAGFREERVRNTLRRIVVEGDPSYFVQMAAASALGKSGGREEAELLRQELQGALDRRDWHDTMATGCVEGLVAARDEEAVDLLLQAAADTSRYWLFRVTAIRGLGELGAARPRIAPRVAEELPRFLDDPRILVANRTPAALSRLGDASVIGPLRRKAETTPRDELRESCLKAVEEIASGSGPKAEIDRLRSELEKLREETGRLRENLEALRTTVAPKERTAARRKPIARRPATPKPAAKRKPAGSRRSPGRR